MTKTDQERPTAKDENNALLLQSELADGLQQEIGLKSEFAQQFAARLVGYLRRRLGAQEIYIPKPSKAERDAAIFREFNGTNAGDVMARHGIKSRSRLYQIIEEQRELAKVGRDPASPVFPLKTGQQQG